MKLTTCAVEVNLARKPQTALTLRLLHRKGFWLSAPDFLKSNESIASLFGVPKWSPELPRPHEIFLAVLPIGDEWRSSRAKSKWLPGLRASIVRRFLHPATKAASIATSAGIQPSALSAHENGNRSLSRTKQEALATSLGVQASFLTDGYLSEPADELSRVLLGLDPHDSPRDNCPEFLRLWQKWVEAHVTNRSPGVRIADQPAARIDSPNR